ncbi:MAG: biotin/lipoyl-binding protein, partial [Deltaproteobacteria bacterium]|nr:biotin/lipoyl-binding protein [Deltaproteobacteria bacterium]
MAEFRMPSLGADMDAGTLIQWLVKPGDAVKRGDIIAVVDTEKAAVEIEVFEAGVIQTIVVQEGEKVPVGTVLALILSDGQPVATGAAPEAKPKPAAPPPPAAPAPSPRPAPPLPSEKVVLPRVLQVPSGRLRVSPLAMRTAIE